MPATKVQIVGGAFQDSLGNLLANGYLTMQLSGDEMVSGVGQVGSSVIIKVPLDSAGNIQGTTSGTQVFVWPNDVLAPSGSFYTVKGYSANGQLAWGPQYQKVLSSPSPYNVNAWVPVSPSLNVGSGITLQTNGTNNSSQVLLNAINGTGVTITDLGGGSIQFSASGGTTTPSVAQYDATAIGAAISNQVLIASVPSTGFYRLSGYAKITQAATVSSDLGPLRLIWTDGSDGTLCNGAGLGHVVLGVTSFAGAQQNDNGNNNTSSNGVIVFQPYSIFAQSGTSITFNMAYVSAGATPMQYEAHLRLERL